tara:strand:- start:783 stop:1124 length:342 start_codon:yes stop_codon:yes gene_type:complete
VNRKKTNKNNRLRGKYWEKRIAGLLGGARNLDKSRPHTDIETDSTVWEIKSTTANVPAWIAGAAHQLEQAAEESNKQPGGIIKVWTNNGGNARAFLITELDLKELEDERSEHH